MNEGYYIVMPMMMQKILIEEVFFRYGMPRCIKSDNGVQFVTAVMQKVAYCLGIQKLFTPMYQKQILWNEEITI